MTRLRLVLLLILLLPLPLYAQTTGQVTGIALDSLGNTVGGATITVCALGSSGIPCSPVTASTSSNGQGAFSVTVPVGTYTVTIFRLGVVATSSTVVVAPSNITVPNNIVGGTASFTNLTISGTGAFTGSLTAAKPNGRRVIDGVTYPATQTGLQQACNDASTIANGGGICEIPPGTNVTITSTLNIGSTANAQSARLDVDPGATLTVNIASASITNTVLTSNVATYTAANTFATGNTVSISGTTNGAGAFNVKGATITSASGTQFTVAITHANITSAAEGGCSSQIVGACAFIDGIHLGIYSKLMCTEGARNNALGTSIIEGLSQGLTTVRSVVSADQQNGTVEAIYIQGCQFRFFTVTRAMIDMSATFANSYARDNIISNYTGSSTAPGILVSSGTGATGTIGPIELQNNWVLPGTTTTSAIILNGVDPEGLGSAQINAIRLWDNKFESVAGQTVPLLTATGNLANPVVNMNAIGNWFLPSTVTANGYKIADLVACVQCNFIGTTFDPLNSTANPIYGVYLENTVVGGVTDFHHYTPSLSGFTPGNFISTFDNTSSPTVSMPNTSDYIQQTAASGGRSWRIADGGANGLEVSNAPSWFGGNLGANFWNHFGYGNTGASFGYQIFASNPAANRNLTWSDPGGNDAFVFAAAAQTLTNKTLNVPLPSGTGLQIFNTTTSCTTAATAFVTCTTAAISLPVAEADTSYRIVCTPHGPTNFPILVGTTISSATQFTITIEATTAAAATFASYDCLVGHN